jgi:hypothetical protein
MLLNSDSFCDSIRIWMEVIGHLWAELGFWFFSEKRVKISAAANIWRARTFRQVVPVQQAGTVRQRPRPYTVGAESLCRCRWKVRYLKPLDLWSQMTSKCFHYEFERWICRPLSWYNMNCLEFVIILLPVPKVNKLSVTIFLKKKEILPLMGGKMFFFNWREMLYYGLRWVWSEK